jgi:hypothetical protein
MLAGAGLGEESVEAVVPNTNGLVTGHLTIRLNTYTHHLTFFHTKSFLRFVFIYQMSAPYYT